MLQLNCGPLQWAWVDVPVTRETRALGLTQLQGHVVRTRELTVVAGAPTWVVEPVQKVKVEGPLPADAPVAVGNTLVCTGLPDAWLRPLQGFPEEELRDVPAEATS